MRDIGCPRPRGPRRRLRARPEVPFGARVGSDGAPGAPARAVSAANAAAAAAAKCALPPRAGTRRSQIRPRTSWPAPRVQRPSWRWETLAAGARARGRRPGPKVGSPRRAAAGPCPAACRARRSPSGSRAPRGLKGRRGRHRGPLANRDSPTRFLQKPPFMRIYHSAATHKKINTYPSLEIARALHTTSGAALAPQSAADTSHHASRTG